MSVVQVREYHCDHEDCDVTTLTREKFLPEGWAVVTLGRFGASPVEHHLCRACVPLIEGALSRKDQAE